MRCQPMQKMDPDRTALGHAQQRRDAGAMHRSTVVRLVQRAA